MPGLDCAEPGRGGIIGACSEVGVLYAGSAPAPVGGMAPAAARRENLLMASSNLSITIYT